MATIYALLKHGRHEIGRYPVTVDDCDAHLGRWTWRLTQQGHVYRNFSYIKGGGGKSTQGRKGQGGRKACRRIYLHRLIMGLHHGDPLVVDHLNNNPLDNRRENLEVVTKQENTRRAMVRDHTVAWWETAVAVEA